jgi:SAM-dependent MidA family methyltransferase
VSAKKTNAAKEWVDVATFESFTAAARRIREIEGHPSGGIFLEIDFGNDEEAFSVPHHSGRRALYGIRRRVH